MHTDFRCCHGFSCGNTAYTVSFKTGIVHVALQHLSSCLLHLFDQMKCCLFHGFTGNVCRTGCVRSGIVRWGVGICTGYCDPVRITFQTFRCHLRQCRITSGSHISSTDREQICSIFVQLNGRRSYIHIGNTGSLHGHGHTDASHFSVAHIPARELLFPPDHLCRAFQTTIQRTTVVWLTIISRHDIAFPHHIYLTQLHRIHMQFLRQFVYRWFQCKLTLCRTISTICSCRHYIGIHNIVIKTECLCFCIKRNGFVSA